MVVDGKGYLFRLQSNSKKTNADQSLTSRINVLLR